MVNDTRPTPPAHKHAFEELFALLEKVFVAEDCCVCLENPPTIVMIPCGHQALCQTCFNKVPPPLKNCYMCREIVLATREQPL